MDTSTLSSEQIQAIRLFIDWLCPMDSCDVADAVDRLSESETDDEFIATMAEIEADDP